MTRRTRALVIALMTVILAACAVRLFPYVRFVARHSLQADFSAYYVAGKSLNHGRSPYLNHAADDRSLWDGVSLWRPSRFLYPPLAALPFRPLAALPYATAKAAWIALTFALAAAALWLARRASGQRQWSVLLAATVWLVAGWPFLLEIERGQIDFVTLGLVLGASLLGRRAGRRFAAGAGGLWAAAILLKLHVAYALPFLLLRRRFAIVGYTLAGSAALLLLSTAVMPGATYDYLTRTLPSLIDHGIDPQPGSELPAAVLRSLLGGAGPFAFAHGGRYLRFPLSFDDHASLVWALAGESAKMPGLLSLGLAGAMVLGVALALRARRPEDGGSLDAADDLAWLVLVLCCVLLAAPLTWPMNTVWLAPAVFVLLARGQPGDTGSRLGQAVGIAGLVLVALPDRQAWPWPLALHWLSRHKYVLGELAVAIAMLARLRKAPVPSPSERAGEDGGQRRSRTTKSPAV